MCFLGYCLLLTSVPSCLSACLLLGALQSTTQGRGDQRQGAFQYPPPHHNTHNPTAPATSSSTTTTFFHWLLMFCKESPGTLTPSPQLSPWPQCPVPTLYPDVRRIVEGRKRGAPGSAPLHPQPQMHHPS